MKGCEHFAFHMGGSHRADAGRQSRFMRAGYQSFWGPGRHKFGSNWFWYFNSPLGCHVEYDADMDQHDDEWSPREAPMGPEGAQAFLFEYRERWASGGLASRREGAGPLMTRLIGQIDDLREGKRALSDRSRARASKPSRCVGPVVSTSIGTPARTTAARRWRGAATPILTPLAIASSAPRTGPNSRSKPGYASTGPRSD